MWKIKKFQTEAEYSTYITGSTAFHPNVSRIVENGEVKYEKVIPMVDLGLPIGTKWAKYNLGANSETEYGDYFAWGETTPRGEDWTTTAPYDWAHSPIPQEVSDLSQYVDSSYNLLPEYDAAHVQLGGDWHMPTSGQVKELKDYTTSAWTENYQGSGINGSSFTGPNGNHIFIPAAGRRDGSSVKYVGVRADLWGPALKSNIPANAQYFYFYSGVASSTFTSRYYGFCIRPVC